MTREAAQKAWETRRRIRDNGWRSGTRSRDVAEDWGDVRGFDKPLDLGDEFDWTSIDSTCRCKKTYSYKDMREDGYFD